MNLSKTERITLIMLHEILAKVKPNESDYHVKAVEILRDGYYDLWENECLGYLSDPMPREKMVYVHDVLDMYRYLQDSYDNLSKADKKKVKDHEVFFKGFDGNYETDELGYARFVLETMGRWGDLKYDHHLNTHYPTKEMYGQMLQKLPQRREYNKFLSAEELRTILDRT